MSPYRFTTALILTATILSGCTAPTTGDQRASWQPVALRGVSGLAPAGSRWIAISDAKGEGEPRGVLIERSSAGAIQTRPLRWIGSEPVDLEALSAVPGAPGRFIAVTSKGEWSALTFDGAALRVTASGNLPAREQIDELEGFSLARIGGRSVAVWGNRGSNSKPGRLFWAEWASLQRAPFGEVTSAPLTLPWPRRDVRHISDLRLDPDGRLLVSSAADPGDKGPFASAVWQAGRFEVSNNGLNWRPLAKPIQVLRDGPDGHKVEAISADSTGGLVVASDDEALGSAIRFGSR